MGGKKTVGAHPTRGHYHNTTTSGRSHPATGDSAAEIPFTQEFSLFCADVISDTSSTAGGQVGGGISTATALPPFKGDHMSLAQSTTSPFGQWYHSPESTWGGDLHVSRSQVADLESQVEALRQAVHNLEASIGDGATDAGPEGAKKVPGGGKQLQETKRLLELLKTVEGRQKSIQSKISHLDNVFGPSAAAWAQGTERLRFMMEYFESMQGFPAAADPTYGAPYGYPPGGHMPQYAPPIHGYHYGQQLRPPSYTTSFVPQNAALPYPVPHVPAERIALHSSHSPEMAKAPVDRESPETAGKSGNEKHSEVGQFEQSNSSEAPLEEDKP